MTRQPGATIVIAGFALSAFPMTVVAAEAEQNPTVFFYNYDFWQPLILIPIASLLAAGFLVGTLIYIWRAWQSSLRLLPLLIVIWAIVPPIWFWAEYFFLYKKFGTTGTFDFFQYGQQTAGAIWAGALAVLLAFGAASGSLRRRADHYLTAQHAFSELQDVIRKIALERGQEGLPQVDFMQKTGLPPQTLSDILQHMVDQGILVHDQKAGFWRTPPGAGA